MSNLKAVEAVGKSKDFPLPREILELHRFAYQCGRGFNPNKNEGLQHIHIENVLYERGSETKTFLTAVATNGHHMARLRFKKEAKLSLPGIFKSGCFATKEVSEIQIRATNAKELLSRVKHDDGFTISLSGTRNLEFKKGTQTEVGIAHDITTRTVEGGAYWFPDYLGMFNEFKKCNLSNNSDFKTEYLGLDLTYLVDLQKYLKAIKRPTGVKIYTNGITEGLGPVLIEKEYDTFLFDYLVMPIYMGD